MEVGARPSQAPPSLGFLTTAESGSGLQVPGPQPRRRERGWDGGGHSAWRTGVLVRDPGHLLLPGPRLPTCKIEEWACNGIQGPLGVTALTLRSKVGPQRGVADSHWGGLLSRKDNPSPQRLPTEALGKGRETKMHQPPSYSQTRGQHGLGLQNRLGNAAMRGQLRSNAHHPGGSG